MKIIGNCFIAIFTTSIVISTSAFAASGTWESTASSAAWNLKTNWNGSTIANGSGSTAFFDAVNITADTTVNLTVNRTIRNLIFGDTATATAGSWILEGGGGTMTLAGETPTITVNELGAGKFSRISAGIAGTSGFTKNGSGTLFLDSTGNSLSGPVILSGGVLQLNNASLSNSTSLALNDGQFVLATGAADAIGGTISFGGGTLQYSGITTDFSSRFSTAASQAYRVDTNSQNLTWAGALTSSGGSLTKSGAGNLTLTGGLANTFDGAISVNGGILSITDGVSHKNVTGAITVASGASFYFHQGFTENNLTNALILSGKGVGSAGALNLGANATSTGPITLLADSTISHDWNAATINGAIVGADKNLQLTTTQSEQPGLTIGGPITLGTGGITVDGAGGISHVMLSGVNTYTGGTAINAGTLSIGNAAALGSTGTISFGGGTLQYSGITTDFSSRFSTAASQAYRVDTNGQNVTWAGALTSSGGSLTKSGAGNLTLTGGLANTFDGPINVAAGQLAVTDGVSHKNSTGAITVVSGGSYHFNQAFTGNNLTNAISLSGVGDGICGALHLGGNATSSGSITLVADATISHDWNVATIDGGITSSGKNLTLVTMVASQLGIYINGPIQLGSGTLILNGIGTSGSPDLVLNGTNQWAAVVVKSGNLYFNQDAAMGGTGRNIKITSGGVASLNGSSLAPLLARIDPKSTGAIAFGAAGTFTEALDLTNFPSLSIGGKAPTTFGGTLTPGGANYRLGGGGSVLTVTSNLAGNAGLIVNDTMGGSVILTKQPSYTGPTTITSGTLRVSGQLAGAVEIETAGTLVLGSSNDVGGLILASPLNVSGNLAMRIDRANAQKADLITAPSVSLTGTLTVTNTGAALELGDSFQLFAVSGSITQNNANFNLPALAADLTWDCSGFLTNGIIKVAALTNIIGDPNLPGLLPSQMQAVYAAGYPSVTINPGTYQLPDLQSSQASFVFSSAKNFTINGSNVVFLVGKQRCFLFENCSKIALQGVTIRAKYPSFTQGRVLSKGITNDVPFAIWKVSDGYPNIFDKVAFNAVNQNTLKIDLDTGTNYKCPINYQGNQTWKIDFPGKTSLPCSVNDWLVARLTSNYQQGHAVFLSNSKDCTIQSVTSQGGGFATFFEGGGGGNHLLSCAIQLSPKAPAGGTELPVVSCAADGVHTANTYPGLDIQNLVCTGAMLDDCIAIHGYYQNVVSVSGNTIICSGRGSMFVVGDPVRISSAGDFFAQATCTAIKDLGNDSYQLTLDEELAVPADAKACNPKYSGAGFKILNCQLGNTRSRAIITKADDGRISGCTIRNADIATNIGPEYYWNESDYSWNITISENKIFDCGAGLKIVSDGAIGNRNFVIQNNVFGINGLGVSIQGCDGASISGNSFAAPSAADAIQIENSKNITQSKNLFGVAPQ